MKPWLVRLIAYFTVGVCVVEVVRCANALLEFDREQTAELLAKLEPERSCPATRHRWSEKNCALPKEHPIHGEVDGALDR